MFIDIDTNKNGTICSNEFRVFLDDVDLKSALDEAQKSFFFDIVDQNNNGRIEYMEFIAATIRKQIFDNINVEEDLMDLDSHPLTKQKNGKSAE